MKLTVLTDNVAGGRFQAEHGLSYLIETDTEKILFDTGHSDVFLKNAKKLGIDIQHEVQKIVLSHGHWDHGNGLQFLRGQTLITHPEAFQQRFRKKNHSPVGLEMSREEITASFDLITAREPVQITDKLWYLGEIPRTNEFEAQATSFEFSDGSEDFVSDDSALAAVVNNQLVIISGCAHSGICNICEYAKKVTGISKIKAVIGGFHLKEQNHQTRETLRYFADNKVEQVFPSHCTELPALALFQDAFHSRQVKTGMVFEF
ncbi:MBL fold metallo-hydrolase [Maribellus sp. YY47]|uniref:MBL fold metallo-hydrolase n=1 Tax=Maribellus sp. YY47 TaxID=2929486 RepID=UPI0020017AF4|nr:MBL fold metallo-hydrolase [Maribellus sp. YY47]MCK3684922.1 MBL fold metallo-hydrolase [Maribellus sp. YY47]